MPTLATKSSVLDGRAEVVSYAWDTSVFYLRVRLADKPGYRSRRIDGVSNLPEAVERAGTYGAGYSIESQATTSRTSTAQRSPNGRLLQHLAEYLAEETERCEAGVIKPSTLKNKTEALTKHLQGYLTHAGITKPSQVKVGCFDRYQVWRIDSNAAANQKPPSNLTLNKEATIIAGFIGYLVKKRLLDPYEAAQKQDISPKIRLSDTDYDSNPPIRDDVEWRLILTELRRWVKEGEAHPRPRTLVHRRMFWSLILVLKQTGMRPDEARNLRWRDIETEDVGRFSRTQWEEDMAHLQAQGVSDSDLDEEDQAELGSIARHTYPYLAVQNKVHS